MSTPEQISDPATVTPKTVTPRRAAALVGLFLFSLLAVAALLRALAPAPPVPTMTVKLDHLAEHRGDYNLLFFGSSRVHHHISPRLFDRITKRLGHPTRSFNVGVPALRVFDLLALLDEAFALELRGVEWVVVDSASLIAQIAEHNVETSREIFWHTPRGTWWALRSLHCCVNASLSYRLKLASMHLHSFALRQFNIGYLADHLEPKENARHTLGPDGDGFLPFEVLEPDDHGPPGSRRRKFFDRLEGYQRSVRRMRRRPGPEARIEPFEIDLLRRVRARIEATGARAVFVVPPGDRRRDEMHAALREGVIDDLLAFDDSRAYPELFTIENRNDQGHMNKNGAERFTRLLARRFVDEIASSREEAIER